MTNPIATANRRQRLRNVGKQIDGKVWRGMRPAARQSVRRTKAKPYLTEHILVVGALALMVVLIVIDSKF